MAGGDGRENRNHTAREGVMNERLDDERVEVMGEGW